MHWESLQAFLHMGGYAGYVWGSYGATAALLLLEVWLLKRRAAAFKRKKDEE